MIKEKQEMHFENKEPMVVKEQRMYSKKEVSVLIIVLQTMNSLVFSVGLYLFVSYYMDCVLPEKIQKAVVDSVSSALAKLPEASMVTAVVPEIAPEKGMFWFIYCKEFYFCIVGTAYVFYAWTQPQNTGLLIEGICGLRDYTYYMVNYPIGAVCSLFHSTEAPVSAPLPGSTIGPFSTNLEDSISPSLHGFRDYLRGLSPLTCNNMTNSPLENVTLDPLTIQKGTVGLKSVGFSPPR